MLIVTFRTMIIVHVKTCGCPLRKVAGINELTARLPLRKPW